MPLTGQNLRSHKKQKERGTLSSEITQQKNERGGKKSRTNSPDLADTEVAIGDITEKFGTNKSGEINKLQIKRLLRK